VVAAWELALRLRQRRDETGVEVRTITERLGFSRNYWSAVENERKILSEDSLVKLVELLEFDREEEQELLALRRAAKARGWWTRYSGFFDEELQRLFGLEAGAHTVRGYESHLIPGLLQTEEYARALMTPNVTIRQVEIEQRVDARMRRQQRLADDPPLNLTTLISEAALRQQIGGRDVLRRQVQHLADLVQRPGSSIELLVIPFTAHSCGLFGAGTVHLIEFESARLPTVAWQETVTSWGVIDDSTKVRDITAVYREARESALGPVESLETIQKIMKELD
jgi:transcriptional regulator with XRE-family HTH domain